MSFNVNALAAQYGVGAVTDTGSSYSVNTDTYDRSGTGSLYGLTSDDFMKLFLAQLQNQDPTQPMDDSQMLSQLSQMSMLQTFQEVQKALSGSQLAQSSAMIGKKITGIDVNGEKLEGVVTSVVQSTDAGLVLQVGSQYIKPDSVVTVTDPSDSSSGT